MWAISTDDADTLRRFKADLQAPFFFLPDPEGRLVRLFAVEGMFGGGASRSTFVVGEGLKVLKTQGGLLALNPGGAIEACPLRRGKGAPGATDGGSLP